MDMSSEIPVWLVCTVLGIAVAVGIFLWCEWGFKK